MYEPRREKTGFCICENKDAGQLRGNRAFVFATLILQSLYFLNLRFQVSNYLLRLHSQVGVGPGRKPDGRFPGIAAHMCCGFS